jgi:ribonuclease VapC
LIDSLRLEIVDVTGPDARRAFAAFTRFGKGVGGPLNLGDCFAYALAEQEGEGLLYKGADFSRTDIKSALG